MGDWRDLMTAQVALLGAAIRVRSRPRGDLLTPGAVGGEEPVAWERVRQIERAIDRAARFGVFRPRCLSKALALHRLLERAGIRGSRVRIGVRLTDGSLDAHAWVVLKERVVGDVPSHVGRFVEMTDATAVDRP